jgi:hypothetical protein
MDSADGKISKRGSKSPRLSAQSLADQGAIGFVERTLSMDGSVMATSSDDVRLALKRIPTRKAAAAKSTPSPSPSPSPAATPTPGGTSARQADRAAQAALGVLGDAAKHPDRLAERIGQFTEEDLQRLAKLVLAATPPQDEKPPLLSKVDQQLAERGVKLLVKAGSVTINIGSQDRSGAAVPSDRPRINTSSYNSWARRFGRVRDFMLGH